MRTSWGFPPSFIVLLTSLVIIIVVQLLSHVWLFVTPSTLACLASLSFTDSEVYSKFTQIHVHWFSDAIQPSHSLSSPSPPAFNLSQQQSFPMSQFFASGGQSIGVSASASVLPMNIQGWFPLGWTGWILQFLAVQGTLKSLLQHCRSKASFLWCSVFFIVQLSRPYMTTGKTIALTTQTFVGKVMSLLFNILSRLVITFLPRSNCLLIS